eukprot:TRINITY_DN4685_c0_g1_i1.p1 TRINITY_DN4685_c0_g1~~TRINITY_DN4685_c0_g1_i1.p1  ORF type:complete len:643 (-),score=71.31 TRINITY_DN4685_c0_g1_i1:751-2679(-)
MSASGSSRNRRSTERPSPYNRATSRACLACRQAHRKCDGATPCQNCIDKGRSDDCSYTAPQKRGPKPTENIYTYCDRIKNELEVQKSIAEYWKQQFAELLQKTSSQPRIEQAERPRFVSQPVESPELLPPDELDMQYILTDIDSDQYIELSSLHAVEICRASIADFTPYIPEVDIVPPSPATMMRVFSMSQDEIHSAMIGNPLEFLALFTQAVLGLLGSSFLEYEAYSARFLIQIECFLNRAFLNNTFLLPNKPEVAAPLAAAMLLLWLHFLYDDKHRDKLNLIIVVYDIVGRHRERITPSLMFRVHLARLLVASSFEDAVYWYDQLQSISQFHSKPGQTGIIVSVIGNLGLALNILRNRIYKLETATVGSFPKSNILRIEEDENTFQRTLVETECKLAEFECMLSYANIIMYKFPGIIEQLEMTVMTLRIGCLAARAGLLCLMGRPDDAMACLDAFLAAVKLSKREMRFNVYMLYSAFEVAGALGSVSHLVELMKQLEITAPTFSSFGRIRNRCAELLELHGVDSSQSFADASTSTSQINPEHINATISKILQDRNLTVPLEWSGEKFAAEFAVAELTAQHFIVSFNKIRANLDAEIVALEQASAVTIANQDQQATESPFPQSSPDVPMEEDEFLVSLLQE